MRGRVLILAGSAEARAVCAACGGLDVMASLAGLTGAPADLGVSLRTGGFGGEAGFRAALSGVAAVLDATHPFAGMAARTARLCDAAGVPRLRLMRPGFGPGPWRRHGTTADAAMAVAPGARVLLAAGPGSLSPFLERGLALWCRRVDPAPPCDGAIWIVGRPGTVAEEAALLARLRITDLVAKDSGGGRGKLDAACTLGIAVHLIDRPPPPPGDATDDIHAAIAFVRAHAAHRG